MLSQVLTLQNFWNRLALNSLQISVILFLVSGKRFSRGCLCLWSSTWSTLVAEHFRSLIIISTFACWLQFEREKSYNVIVLNKPFALSHCFICPLICLINIYHVLAYYTPDIVLSPEAKEKEKRRQIKRMINLINAFSEVSVLCVTHGKWTRLRKERLGAVSDEVINKGSWKVMSFELCVSY